MTADRPPANAATHSVDTYRLRLPGPIAVPERVREAIAKPMISHR